MRPLGDLELASRLSFFLWSSIPDDELLDVAEEGRLTDPDVLGLQVRRMLQDPRSEALVTNFGGQWLYLRNLTGASPDPIQFPDFDENLRQAMQRETELFFDRVIREGPQRAGFPDVAHDVSQRASGATLWNSRGYMAATFGP